MFKHAPSRLERDFVQSKIGKSATLKRDGAPIKFAGKTIGNEEQTASLDSSSMNAVSKIEQSWFDNFVDRHNISIEDAKAEEDDA